MDLADLKLLALLSQPAIALAHLLLGAWILRRRARGEALAFAGVNFAFAAWHGLHSLELIYEAGAPRPGPAVTTILDATQLWLGLLLLVALFQLYCYADLRGGRPRGLRRALASHFHRRRHFYVPLVWGIWLLGSLAYLLDLGGLSLYLSDLRADVGPTSAYIFAGALAFLAFALFPARPGQEHLVLPQIARGLILIGIFTSAALIASWHGVHPGRTRWALLPWLQAHSLGLVVFLAVVRHGFAFMDRYILRGLQWSAAALVVVAAYWTSNRLVFDNSSFTSSARLLVLLLAVAFAPRLGRRARRWGERYLFGRREAWKTALLRISRGLQTETAVGDLRRHVENSLSSLFQCPQVDLIPLPAARPANPRGGLVMSVAAPDGHTVAWLRLGPRKDMVPFFDGERRFLAEITPQIGAAISRVVPRPAAATQSRRIPQLPPAREMAWRRALRKHENHPEERARLGAAMDRLRAYLGEGAPPLSNLQAEWGFARDWLALWRMDHPAVPAPRLEMRAGLERQEIPRGLLLLMLEDAVGQCEGALILRALAHGEEFELSLEGGGEASAGRIEMLRNWIGERAGDRARIFLRGEATDDTPVQRVLKMPRRDRRGSKSHAA